jgi:uncharacterized protein
MAGSRKRSWGEFSAWEGVVAQHDDLRNPVSCFRRLTMAQTLALKSLDTELAEFCRRRHIRKLSLFGSTLRGNARPDSDVDLLVEFQPDSRVGLIQLARIERELSELIGRKVDLRTPADLSRYFRDEVLREAEVQYEER